MIQLVYLFNFWNPTKFKCNNHISYLQKAQQKSKRENNGNLLKNGHDERKDSQNRQTAA